MEHTDVIKKFLVWKGSNWCFSQFGLAQKVSLQRQGDTVGCAMVLDLETPLNYITQYILVLESAKVQSPVLVGHRPYSRLYPMVSKVRF